MYEKVALNEYRELLRTSFEKICNTPEMTPEMSRMPMTKTAMGKPVWAKSNKWPGDMYMGKLLVNGEQMVGKRIL